MRNFLILLCLLSSTAIIAQEDWDDFSGDEKAFFYRVARTTDILSENIFHLFEFTDSIPYINDTLPDYKYVEKTVVRYPSKLILHSDQLSRISSGIVSDLATHYALWELDRALHYRKSTAESDKPLKEIVKVFEKYVLERAPQTAISVLSDGSYVLRNSLSSYYSPSLNCNDKLAAMKNSGFVQLDQMLCLNAISLAMEKYVAIRTAQIVKALGANGDSNENYLSAAGDGGDYSSLEAGYKPTPQDHLLPDNTGLFDFEIAEVENKKTEKKDLIVKSVVTHDFKTNPEQATVLHFDVYAWHPERQTTIAIQKGGKSYILYGNNSNRLLSPDSTFGEGTTYRRLMWELEHVHIAEMKEKLYGKRGYEYWIKEYEERIQGTLLQIKKTEFKLDKLRHTPEKTPKVKKKKWRKVDLTTSDQAGRGHPTTPLSKNQKNINIEQNRLNYLETTLMNQKLMLARLKKEMEEAYFILVGYENKLDIMQKTLGLLEMEHSDENDFYTFIDGATFNKRTQDFTFPPNSDTEGFKVYHICFGKKVFSTTVEENFVHICKSNQTPDEKYTFHKLVRDNGNYSPMSVSDSIQTMEIFRALAKKETKLEASAIAGGIVGEVDGDFFRKESIEPVPCEKDKNRNEGVMIFHAQFDVALKLYVKVYDDQMIPFGFEEDFPKFSKFKSKYPELNEIDYYTAVRALTSVYSWAESLKLLVPTWVSDPKDQAAILSKLNKIKTKTAVFADGKIEAKVPRIVLVNK